MGKWQYECPMSTIQVSLDKPGKEIHLLSPTAIDWGAPDPAELHDLHRTHTTV